MRLRFDRLPVLDRLESSQRVLISGAGGGFDVFCGLPLFFHLRRAGKEVFLGNLTFASLYGASGRQLNEHVLEVDAESGGVEDYFPEKYLSQWFASRGEQVSVFCFDRTGVAPLIDAYRAVTKHLDLDTVVLVDGGTDSLMRGDEAGLGTPQEDIASLAAVDSLPVDGRFLVALGFGVDHFHGVCHAQFLEAVADLTKRGAFLGAFSLHGEMEEVRLYRDAAEFAFRAMPTSPSIVSSSILAAVAGEYGDHHATDRTAGSKLWINPLMGLYWSFELDAVARRCLYLDLVKPTRSYHELTLEIEKFRATHEPIKGWEEIPV